MTTRAAPSPATDPRHRLTTGTVARFATTHSQPGLNGTKLRRSVSSDFTEPPPPDPSTSRTIGRRSSCAICSACTCFWKIDASAAPPRTVKSSPPTTTARSSIRPRPITKLVGREVDERTVVVGGRPPGEPTDLVEAARVEEGVDPLPHRELAERTVLGDLLLAAHPVRQLGPAAQLLELGLPGGHALVVRSGCGLRPATRLGSSCLLRPSACAHRCTIVPVPRPGQTLKIRGPGCRQHLHGGHGCTAPMESRCWFEPGFCSRRWSPSRSWCSWSRRRERRAGTSRPSTGRRPRAGGSTATSGSSRRR